MKKIYRNYNNNPTIPVEIEMAKRNGQTVEVISTPDEGIPDILQGILPPYYQVRFEDGYEVGVFEDELADA